MELQAMSVAVLTISSQISHQLEAPTYVKIYVPLKLKASITNHQQNLKGSIFFCESKNDIFGAHTTRLPGHKNSESSRVLWTLISIIMISRLIVNFLCFRSVNYIGPILKTLASAYEKYEHSSSPKKE